MLWVLTGEGKMILEEVEMAQDATSQDFGIRYASENKRLKSLESDMEKLSTVLKDKEKIIGLYEFMLNGNNKTGTIADAY
jgi:hypothetical protein